MQDIFIQALSDLHQNEFHKMLFETQDLFKDEMEKIENKLLMILIIK